MIVLPEKCLRNRKDCEPYSHIQSDCHGTFVCCGRNDGTMSDVEQDKFTLCFKSETTDSITCNDKTDLLDLASVVNQALSVDRHLAIDFVRDFNKP